MNKPTIQSNIAKLIELEHPTDGKETFRLSGAYIDVLNRMAILQGTSKTAVVRQALDLLSEQFGDDVLWPELAARD